MDHPTHGIPSFHPILHHNYKKRNSWSDKKCRAQVKKVVDGIPHMRL